MKHFNVLLSGLLALGLTGFVLTHPAWVLGKKSNHLPGRRQGPRLVRHGNGPALA